MNTLKRLVALCWIVMLTACVAPQKKLKPTLPESDKADHVVLFIPQSEIQIDDKDTYGGGFLIGGLAGAVVGSLIEMTVESVMNKNRQKAIAPIRDDMLDFRFEEKFLEAIRTNLPTNLVKSDAPIKIIRSDTEWFEYLAEVAPANLFEVRARYAMTPNFEVAYLATEVGLKKYSRVPPDSKEKRAMAAWERNASKAKSLYSGFYFSQHVTHSPFKKINKNNIESRTSYKKNAKSWAKNNAESTRIAILESINDIASLIKRDGEQTLPTKSKRRNTRAYIADSSSYARTEDLFSVEKSAKRTTAVFGKTIYVIDNLQIRR